MSGARFASDVLGHLRRSIYAYTALIMSFNFMSVKVETIASVSKDFGKDRMSLDTFSFFVTFSSNTATSFNIYMKLEIC